MELTRNQIIELEIVFRTTAWVQSKDKPIKSTFRYALSYNIKECVKEIEAIKDAFPEPAGLVEYLAGEREVYAKYGITHVDQLKDLAEEVKVSLDGEIGAYRESKKEFLDELKAIEEEKKEFLKETVSIDLKTVKDDIVPDIDPENNKYPHWEIWRVLETIVVD